MNLETVMKELEALGTEQHKRIYKNHGAKEPLFGVTTGAMKPLSKKIKKDYDLSMKLYATGNYDAAYFAGMIADPDKMSPSDFETWMETAYCHMMSDYVVAVNLSKTDYAGKLADCWIESGRELYMSAGWNCYSLLFGSRPDDWFDKDKLSNMLDQVVQTIHTQPNWTRYAMNDFVIALGISYLPLHHEALTAAREIGKVEVSMGNTSCKTPAALDYIQKAVQNGKLGFKKKSR